MCVKPFIKTHTCLYEDVNEDLYEDDLNEDVQFYVVIAKINQRMNMIFSNQKEFCLNLACFDSRGFPNIKKFGLPADALDKISSIVKEADKERLL